MARLDFQDKYDRLDRLYGKHVTGFGKRLHIHQQIIYSPSLILTQITLRYYSLLQDLTYNLYPLSINTIVCNK